MYEEGHQLMETTLLFAPLVGALISGFGWKLIGEQAAMWLKIPDEDE